MDIDALAKVLVRRASVMRCEVVSAVVNHLRPRESHHHGLLGGEASLASEVESARGDRFAATLPYRTKFSGVGISC